MSTVPAVPAGDVAVIDVGLLKVKPAAAVPPKLTAVTPLKLVPVIVTEVPPLVGPAVGVTDVIVGAGAVAFNVAMAVLLPVTGFGPVAETAPVT